MSSPPPIPAVTVSAATPSPPKPPLASVESLGFSSPEEGKRRRRRRSGAEAEDNDNEMGEEDAAGVLRLTPEHLRSLPTDAARWEAVAAALSGLADVGSRLARVEGVLGRPGMAPLLFGSASRLAADGGGEEVEDLLLGKSAARSGFQVWMELPIGF